MSNRTADVLSQLARLSLPSATTRFFEQGKIQLQVLEERIHMNEWNVDRRSRQRINIATATVMTVRLVYCSPRPQGLQLCDNSYCRLFHHRSDRISEFETYEQTYLVELWTMHCHSTIRSLFVDTAKNGPFKFAGFHPVGWPLLSREWDDA